MTRTPIKELRLRPGARALLAWAIVIALVFAGFLGFSLWDFGR